jgi:hypothetical protein
MTRAWIFGLMAIVGGSTLTGQEGDEAARVLAGAREALGGEARLAAVRSVRVEGTRTRPADDGTSRATDFEVALALPDKFVKKEGMAGVAGMMLSRTTGFNGDGLIEEMETPQHMGGVMVFRAGSGGSGTETSAEDQEAARRATLLANRQEFARLMLGMFAASFDVHPVRFAYVGVAESPDGTADVLDVTGPDDFAVRLFVDRQTHLPLMLSWMDKEPLSMVEGAGPGIVMNRPGGGGGRGGVQTRRAGSPEELEKMRADMDVRVREAEARRRVVEYRLFYADYRSVDGVKLPTRLQRMIDGRPTEELAFEKVEVNVDIDPKTFDVTRRER